MSDGGPTSVARAHPHLIANPKIDLLFSSCTACNCWPEQKGLRLLMPGDAEKKEQQTGKRVGKHYLSGEREMNNH